jgi:hypothetical protein
LTNQEIINKLTESPTKLKQRAKTLLNVLRKHNVRLSSDGEVDYSYVVNSNVIGVMKRKEALVKVTLMQADLEFEYPQKLEKLLVRSDLLKWLDEEEEKLKRNATESILLMDEAMTGAVAKTIDLNAKKVLTYEDYYDLDDFTVGGDDGNKQKPGKIPFEEFIAKTASENIFDNDVSSYVSLMFFCSCLNNSISSGSRWRTVSLDYVEYGLSLSVRTLSVVLTP